MGMAETIRTALQGQITAASTRIYTFDDTGRLGINRTTVPDAFDANQIIQPTVLVRETETLQVDEIIGGGVRSASVGIALFFYDNNAFTNLDQMRIEAFRALHEEIVDGSFQVFWSSDVRDLRDTELDAFVDRSDYEVFILRR